MDLRRFKVAKERFGVVGKPRPIFAGIFRLANQTKQEQGEGFFPFTFVQGQNDELKTNPRWAQNDEQKKQFSLGSE